MNKILPSELILNDDGSVYHLNLLPEDIADTIILVGDPDRVPKVSQHFDSIELKKQKRELVTHTGYVGNKRLSVVSTGMSTDNIDIVINELDALVNIDLKERTIKPITKNLNLIRLGTAGALQKHIPLDSFIISTFGIGLDGLANFYQTEYSATEQQLMQAFTQHFSHETAMQNNYAVAGSAKLINLFANHANEMLPGITVTCPGFYGPQGRTLRAQPKIAHLVEQLQKFNYNHHYVANFEMETAGIYTMGRILEHHCCSISATVANRVTGEFSTQANQTIDRLIRLALEKLSVEQTAEIA